MKFIEPVKKHKFLLVFVHGLIGGEDTWIRKDGKKSILQYLADDGQIRASFDIALFKYDTTLIDSFLKLRYFVRLVSGWKIRFTRNLAIRKNSELLINELESDARDYEHIVIISHSMGGLISKQVILDEIERSNHREIAPRIGLYISLATPHSGAELASLGKLLLSSVQIKNLSPTNEYLLELNKLWVQSTQLPKRIYIRGFNDQIVPEGADAIDAKKNYPISSKDDHFSILVPTPETKHVLNGIKDACIDFLKDNGGKVEKSIHIDVPMPPLPPKPKPWRLYILLLVLAGGAIFFVVKSGQVCNACPVIDSTGLVGYYIQKSSDSRYYVTDFNDTTRQKLKVRLLEEFIERYVGHEKLIDRSVLSQMTKPDFRESDENLIHLKFSLPDDKRNWGGFVVGIDKNYYDRAKGINDINKKWIKLNLDAEDKKIKWVYFDKINNEQPIFTIPK
jgi:hypothetical protein